MPLDGEAKRVCGDVNDIEHLRGLGRGRGGMEGNFIALHLGITYLEAGEEKEEEVEKVEVEEVMVGEETVEEVEVEEV